MSESVSEQYNKEPSSWRFLKFIPRLWANFSGIVLLTIIVTYLLIYFTSQHDGAVVWQTTAFKLQTPVVKEQGELIYTASMNARESCPGRFLHTFLDYQKSNTNVTLQRPLIQPGVNVVNRTFVVNLPPALTSGHWKVVGSITSDCATRQQNDKVAEFEIDVVPNEDLHK